MRNFDVGLLDSKALWISVSKEHTAAITADSMFLGNFGTVSVYLQVHVPGRPTSASSPL
jgi:hypothetical protein